MKVNTHNVLLDETWLSATEALSDEEKGRLIDLVVNYGCFGIMPSEFIGNERFVFPLLRNMIDDRERAIELKALASRINGKKGGRPKKD